jgi:hypothetical protein
MGCFSINQSFFCINQQLFETQLTDLVSVIA